MKAFSKILIVLATMLIFLLGMTACSSSGGSGYSRSSMHYGYGYRGYRGNSWGYGGNYYPGGGGGIGGGGPVDPDWGVDAPSAPIAVPMPEMGMPDMGGMDFDW